MTEEQAQKMIDLLEQIDWKLWELYKHLVPQEQQDDN